MLAEGSRSMRRDWRWVKEEVSRSEMMSATDAVTEQWPAYDDYQQKTDREIPVVVLTPR